MVLETVVPVVKQETGKIEDLVREQEGRLERQEEETKHQKELNKVQLEAIQKSVDILATIKK